MIPIELRGGNRWQRGKPRCSGLVIAAEQILHPTKMHAWCYSQDDELPSRIFRAALQNTLRLPALGTHAS